MVKTNLKNSTLLSCQLRHFLQWSSTCMIVKLVQKCHKVSLYCLIWTSKLILLCKIAFKWSPITNLSFDPVFLLKNGPRHQPLLFSEPGIERTTHQTTHLFPPKVPLSLSLTLVLPLRPKSCWWLDCHTNYHAWVPLSGSRIASLSPPQSPAGWHYTQTLTSSQRCPLPRTVI